MVQIKFGCANIDQLRGYCVKLNEQSDDTTDIEREKIDTAEPRRDGEDTDKKSPAEDLVAKPDINSDTRAEDLIAEPDINPERTAPVVRQEETSSAAKGFRHEVGS